MLLMFGVGLHFSLGDLLAVRKIAIPGAMVQMPVATLMGVGAPRCGAGACRRRWCSGLALSVASTVVLLRALESLGLLESFNGRIAVGWLVVEDLAMVLVLVLLPPLASTMGGGKAPMPRRSGPALASPAAGRRFVVLMLVVGRRLPLAAVAGAAPARASCSRCAWWPPPSASPTAPPCCSAFPSRWGPSSPAWCCANRSSAIAPPRKRCRCATPSRCCSSSRSACCSIRRILVDQPLHVLAVVLASSSSASRSPPAMLVLLLRYPLHTALTVSASLAQIGEFSFILVGLGVAGLMPAETQSLVLAGALISIALNPLCSRACSRCSAGCWRARSRARPRSA
jgi:CPA2 family monovalent cation:H+ antiporter-2